DETGSHPEARHDVQAPECFAHERRNRGGKPAGAGSSCRVHGPAMSGTAVFNRLALIGMGLIGSSIARAARAQGAAKSIVATARSAATRRRVAELGLADQIIESNAAAVEGADLVILCIPVGACGAVAAEISSHLSPGAILSDLCSVKCAVLRDIQPHIHYDLLYVLVHPVDWTEHHAPDAYFSELFVNL